MMIDFLDRALELWDDLIRAEAMPRYGCNLRPFLLVLRKHLRRHKEALRKERERG